MSNQTEKRKLKKAWVAIIESILNEHGYVCERTVKGLALFNPVSGLWVLIDAVVKNEEFDIDDAIMEWEDKLKKEEERAQKQAEKLVKEQAKKDKKE